MTRYEIECDSDDCMIRYEDAQFCIDECPCFIKAKEIREEGEK